MRSTWESGLLAEIHVMRFVLINLGQMSVETREGQYSCVPFQAVCVCMCVTGA